MAADEFLLGIDFGIATIKSLGRLGVSSPARTKARTI